MLATHKLLLIQSRTEEIHIYSISYVMYSWSYYENTSLSPCVTSWTGFQPP